MTNGRGRPKKLTPRQVENGIKRNFKSITITKPLYEYVPDGRDENGKEKFKKMPVLNDLKKQVYKTEYIEHPSMTKLAHFLKIHRETLINYGKDEEYIDSIKNAKETIESYLEDKLYGNNVTGVIFNLKNNYGWEDRQKHDLTIEKSLEDWFDEE